MIIDSSYFSGPLTLAQLGQQTVVESLDNYIQQYEPEYLERVLGYELSKSFIAGLQAAEIEQKWMDLLNGAEFTYYGKLHKWPGLAGVTDVGNIYYLLRKPLFIRGGITDGFAVGDNKYVNADLANWNISLDIRTFGPQEEGEEWNEIEDGGIQLTDDDYQVAPGEIWVINFLSKKTGTTVSEVRGFSPIAAYVYWHYVRDLHQQQTGIGTVKTKGQNSTPVSPIHKMMNAWNMMVDSEVTLTKFLSANREVYNWHGRRHCVHYQNQFGV